MGLLETEVLPVAVVVVVVVEVVIAALVTTIEGSLEESGTSRAGALLASKNLKQIIKMRKSNKQL